MRVDENKSIFIPKCQYSGKTVDFVTKTTFLSRPRPEDFIGRQGEEEQRKGGGGQAVLFREALDQLPFTKGPDARPEPCLWGGAFWSVLCVEHQLPQSLALFLCHVLL